MSRLTKFGLLISGFVLACLLASAVVYVWQLNTQNVAAQVSADRMEWLRLAYML